MSVPIPRPIGCCVLGLGNVLLADDAFGPLVIALLTAKYQFPHSVNVLDVGTPGLELAPYLNATKLAVVVDAIRAEGAPGLLLTFRKREILRRCAPLRFNAHAPGLPETLAHLEMVGQAPEKVLLIGAIPETSEPTDFMSPRIRKAASEAVHEIVRVLSTCGFGCKRRLSPAKPDVWWEAEKGRACT